MCNPKKIKTMTQPTTVTDELFAHLRDSPKLPDLERFPIEDFNPLEELQADAEPDDTPYNSWERNPDGCPGNNGPLTL